MTDEKCQETVIPPGRFGSFHTSTCNRPVKNTLSNGKKVCGIHFAADKRRRKNAIKYEEKNKNYDSLKEELHLLKEKHGIKSARLIFDKPDTVLIKFSEFKALLNEIL